MATTLYSHQVRMPPNFLVLRIFQLVFSVLVLAIAIWAVVTYAADGVILSIVTSLVSIVTLIYIISASNCAPAAYNYWAILSLEIFCVLFWLISFAVLATNVVYSNSAVCDYDECIVEGLSDAGYAALSTAAGLGGVLFLLYVVSLSIFSVMLYRHRRDGGHSKPGGSYPNYRVGETYNPNGPGAAAGPNGVTSNAQAEKYEMNPQAQVYPVQHGQYAQPQPISNGNAV